jgi:hypothetical protein
MIVPKKASKTDSLSMKDGIRLYRSTQTNNLEDSPKMKWYWWVLLIALILIVIIGGAYWRYEFWSGVF